MPSLIKQLKWFLVDQFMFHVGGGGGGGSPAPVTQNVSNTNIPEYARPYVENTLGQAAALTDINQNPYQTYGGQRIADFSPLQQQAFANVASMTTAAQLKPATSFATQSGQGSIDTAGRMAGAGDRYAAMATDPSQMQAYMNPYVQASLQPQLNLLNQQAGIQGAAQQGAATQAGAFGGSRSALANSLSRQNSLMAQQAAIGQGYNQAFQQAQQAQQFGANLGLQGMQGALSGYGQAGQAAATLGQLGQTEFAQQDAINRSQQTTGAVQQAQAQQGLDQSYQDFLKQKNYPYQQLAFMSDMYRGLPLSQTANTMYQAPPNAASQLGGLGMSALGIYGMSGGFKGNAEGGLMAAKRYKEGGKIGYNLGGDISMMNVKQLTEMLDNPTLSPMEVEMIQKRIMLLTRMENNPEAAQIMAPAEGQSQGRAGIGAIATGDMVPEEGLAGGGIVAFARGGSPNEYDALEKAYFDKALQRLKEPATTGDPFAESKATEAAIRAQLAENKRVSPYEALAMAGLGTMAGTSPYALTNLGLGGIQGMKSMGASKAEQDQLNKLLLQQGVEREKSQFARQMAREGQADTAIGALIGKRSASELAAATRASSGSNTSLTNTIRAQSAYDTAINNEKRRLLELNKATYGDLTSSQLDSDAKANVDAKLTPAFKALIQLPMDEGVVAPGKGSKTPAPPKGYVVQ